MRHRRPIADDSGFTLIEMLIAMIVMGVAVVALVAAMAGLINTTQHNKGHAAVESTVQNFGQAVQAKVSFHTKLNGAITAGANSMTVADGSGLPTANFKVSVDRETIGVTSRTGNTLSGLTRGVGDPTSAVAHQNQAPVLPLFRCPSITDLTPSPGTYDTFASNVSAQITKVEYLNPTTGTFVNQAGCSDPSTGFYDAACTYVASNGSIQPDIRQECDPGVERLTVSVTTTGNSLRGIQTVGQVVVRRGSDSVA